MSRASVMALGLGLIAAIEVPSKKAKADKPPRNVDATRLEKRRLHKERMAQSKGEKGKK